MKTRTCDFCSNPPVLIDLEVEKTILYCQEHQKYRPVGELVAPTREGRIAYIAKVMQERSLRKLCYECGQPSISTCVTIFAPTRYYCDNHQVEADEFLLEYS